MKRFLLPGTNRPHTLKYGNKHHGSVYAHIKITKKTAFGIVNFPSNGFAMTLYLGKWRCFQSQNDNLEIYSQNKYLSYAMNAFVIAAPIPDIEPTKANTSQVAVPNAIV